MMSYGRDRHSLGQARQRHGTTRDRPGIAPDCPGSVPDCHGSATDRHGGYKKGGFRASVSLRHVTSIQRKADPEIMPAKWKVLGVVVRKGSKKKVQPEILPQLSEDNVDPAEEETAAAAAVQDDVLPETSVNSTIAVPDQG